MSPKSAGQAVKAGYTKIKVMLAGQPGWTKSGQPIYANYGAVCQGNNVVVDLRSKEADFKARLPRSVSIPMDTLDDAIEFEEIPIKAPVILYGDTEEQAIAAMKKLKAAGFKKVALVEGGFQGWKRLGGKLIVEKPIVTEAIWKRILAEGEVSLDAFNKALADPSLAFILDVRTRDEIAAGKFKQSIHVPLDELCQDMDAFCADLEGVNKGQKVYIHCTTGARAEMAYKELAKRGFNAYYLVAEVACEGNDCEVNE